MSTSAALCWRAGEAPGAAASRLFPRRPRLYLAACRRPDGSVVTFDKNGNETGPLPRVSATAPALLYLPPSLAVACARGTEASCLALTHDQNGTRRTIVWDEENRIQSLFDNGHEKTYKYDALQGRSNAARDRMSGAADQGNRLIKRGPQGETVYVNQFYTQRPGATGTKHVYAGTTRIASKLVRQDTPNSNPAGKTPFEKDLYFYHPDHLGASNYITDLNAKLYEHLEYFPFGEAWVEENSNTQRTPYLFTAKELDEETGLYYFGARYYDPRTSVWQSADPILGKYLPDMVKIENKLNKKRKETDGQTGMLDIAQKLPVLASWSPKEELPGGGVFNSLNLNLYAYSYQNPVVYNDPTGLAPPIEQATPLAVTSGFGQRNIPQSPNAFHYGADLRAPVGTEARAVSPGVVVRAGNASGGSRVIIRHDDGSYTWTRHINPSVQQGQRVGENDVIGRTCTGGSCGTNEPHLHFERQAPGATAKTNPVPFIRQEEAAAAAARSQTP